MTLRIQLFGKPRLLAGETPLPFNAPPKTLPLLSYLLLNRQQMLERQQVAFTLWPDDPEAAARANLRRHLHQLQNALPPGPPENPWLLGDARSVRWNPQADAWLDVAEFEHLASNPDTLSEAVQLYTGDLLETIYDDWVFFERERLRELYFNCLIQLVFQHRTRRNYPAAIGFAQQLLGRDAFREDIVRQLISLRYESGDRAGAIQEFENFERHLRQEMGVAPMPETQAVLENVLRNTRLPAADSPAAYEAVFPIERPCATPVLPFVGRATEMEQMAACWSRAARGRGGLLLVGGEAGVGKTRLARELALLAEKQGGRVLYGGNTPNELRPHQALAEVLQSAMPLLAALDSAPQQLAALSILVPELRIRRSLPTLPPLDPDRERTRLFDAVATCLAGLAEPRPLLVILEDWHWAGEASIALLEFISRRAAGYPLLLLGTYRDEETPRIHPLRSLHRRLQSENLAVHVPLSRLAPRAVDALVSQIADGQPEIAQRLYTESEGNPLFIEMLWQSWQETGETAARLPGGVQTVIAQRLERLPAAVHAYAEVAAVLGPAFDAEAAREVGGWDEAQAYAALRELLDCRLLRDAEGRSRFDYVFAHHLIQTVLYTEIPPAKRKRRHRRAAEVLECLYPERQAEMAGELAAHYDLGEAPDQAIPHYLAAACQRLAVFADTEALSAIGRALEMAEAFSLDLPGKLLADLLLLRESIYNRHGERPAQEADLQRLTQLAASDPELKCEVLKRRILYHKGKDEHELQKELVEAFKAQVQTLGSPRWQAEAVFAEGNYLKVTDDYPAAITRLEQAFVLYDELQDCNGQVTCCCQLAEIFVVLRQSAQAETWAQRAFALCDPQQPSHQLMNTLWSLAANGFISKRLEDCRKYAHNLLEMSQQANDRVWQAAALRLIGMVDQRQFRIAEARLNLNAALDLYSLSQKPKGCALTLQSLGHVELSVGNSAGARQCYQRAFDIQQQLKDPNGMAMEAINLGSAASQQADYAAEREAAQQGLSLARQLNNHFMEAMSLQNLGEAERETGDLPTALQHLTNALSLLEDPTLLSERSGVYADLALTQWKAGDLPQALKSAGEILTLYPQIEGTDDNLHRHLWAAARVLHAAGQSTRAGQALEQTYQAFQSCMNSLPDSDLRQTYSNLHYNRQIAAAHDRGEWS